MGYSDILDAAKQLPDELFFQLKSDIDKAYSEREDLSKKKKKIKKLLLECSVMTDEQYEEYLENRRYFREWRKN